MVSYFDSCRQELPEHDRNNCPLRSIHPLNEIGSREKSNEASSSVETTKNNVLGFDGRCRRSFNYRANRAFRLKAAEFGCLKMTASDN